MRYTSNLGRLEEGDEKPDAKPPQGLSLAVSVRAKVFGSIISIQPVIQDKKRCSWNGWRWQMDCLQEEKAKRASQLAQGFR
jgi:hypothetical protein